MREPLLPMLCSGSKYSKVSAAFKPLFHAKCSRSRALKRVGEGGYEPASSVIYSLKDNPKITTAMRPVRRVLTTQQ
eukprot:scaffold171723_cov18-Tisochrysis_lutea.AAC.1